MASPFNRSSMTPRSPPPERDEPESDDPPPDETAEIVSTPELKNWLSKVEQCLNEICTISSEGGKLNSDSKLRISTISRSVMGGISQMAVHYQQLKQKLIAANTALKNIHKDKSISDQIRELKTSVQSAQKESPQIVSYANMVRKGNDSIVRPANSSSITIYPVDKDKSSEETKKLVQNLVRPDELKLQIRAVRKIRNGGVIISTDRKDDLDKIKKSDKLISSGLKIEDTLKKRPKIIIIGVPSEMPERELLECLFEQNVADIQPPITREQFLSSLKLSHKSGKKDTATCNYILEVSAELRRVLIKQQRVYINWTSCPVRDFTLVTRCYNCQQYGHSAKFCRDSDPTCGHCGSGGHSIKECPARAEPAKCATCMRYKKPCSHKTGDEQCPAKKSAVSRYLSSIDYEGA